MTPQELRELLKKRSHASRANLSIIRQAQADKPLTNPNAEFPFHQWWFEKQLTPEQQHYFEDVKGLTYLSDMLLTLSDEELMFAWAVYWM